MTKKLMCVAACIFAAIAVTACSEHTHTLTDFDVNNKNHWKLCGECGEKVEEGVHTLNDRNACTVCGCEIEESDKSTFVYRYDENGNLRKTAVYNTADVLRNEIEYDTVDGENKIIKHTLYANDGTKSVNEYDLHGNLTIVQFYDEKGDLYQQSFNEYSLLNADEWYKIKCTTMFDDGTKHVLGYDTHGEEIYFADYDIRGVLLYEKEQEHFYTDEGDRIFTKCYLNGVLEREIAFKKAVSENTKIIFPETVTEYYEDGSKTVTVYNENLKIVSETHYDPAGNVLS